MSKKIYYVKVFTKNSKYGNLAGVVPNAFGFSDKKMQKIAKITGASETVFIFPSKKADFKIRWFTPNTEVGLCVHATIAAIGILRKLNLIKKRDIVLETKNTLLKVKIVKNKIFVLLNGYKLLSNKIEKEVLSKYLKIKNTEITKEPKVVEIFDDRELMIQVSNLKVLKNLKPNKILYTKLCKLLKITGISIFTKETFDKSNQIHTREFAPLYGYLEDPLTGMAAPAIVKYTSLKSKSIKIEQGNFLKKHGIIEVIQCKNGLLIGGDYVIYKLKDIV